MNHADQAPAASYGLLGELLFVLYGGAGVVDECELQMSVVFGPERTVEQDPLFAFRILVDMAIEALSKGRSMVRRRLCWPSIGFTGFCKRQEAGISGPIRFSIELGNFM